MTLDHSKPGTGIEQDTFTLEDLSYDLPEELIAQEPLAVRHESKLLVLDRAKSEIHHSRFSDIASYLNPGDLLIVNDTRVLPARLLARRHSGGEVRIQLIKACTRNNHLWEAMGMPLRRIKSGEYLHIETPEESGAGPAKAIVKEILIEEIIEDADGYKRLIINFLTNENMRSILSKAGHAPLPPYIRRELDPADHDLDRKRKE
ncbi:MAG TPA: S-adenosylmethionine:tRNA ribosyltransferase-isomerase, partial [Candidatus Melainabacteria bacterium]|nr:S-adenosylmethionine:tRNA ribosyltransferase-isomerase [Candidatus Melainabacteria bacterium]